MDIIEHYRVYFVISNNFSCNSVLLWRPIWPKRTQKCVYGDEMFLSSKVLKHSSPINRLLHINLDTSNAAFAHHGTKVRWTIQDIL